MNSIVTRLVRSKINSSSTDHLDGVEKTLTFWHFSLIRTNSSHVWKRLDSLFRLSAAHHLPDIMNPFSLSLLRRESKNIFSSISTRQEETRLTSDEEEKSQYQPTSTMQKRSASPFSLFIFSLNKFKRTRSVFLTGSIHDRMAAQESWSSCLTNVDALALHFGPYGGITTKVTFF